MIPPKIYGCIFLGATAGVICAMLGEIADTNVLLAAFAGFVTATAGLISLFAANK